LVLTLERLKKRRKQEAWMKMAGTAGTLRTAVKAGTASTYAAADRSRMPAKREREGKRKEKKKRK